MALISFFLPELKLEYLGSHEHNAGSSWTAVSSPRKLCEISPPLVSENTSKVPPSLYSLCPSCHWQPAPYRPFGAVAMHASDMCDCKSRQCYTWHTFSFPLPPCGTLRTGAPYTQPLHTGQHTYLTKHKFMISVAIMHVYT